MAPIVLLALLQGQAAAQDAPVEPPAPPPPSQRARELPLGADSEQLVVVVAAPGAPQVRVSGVQVPLADDGQGVDAVADDGVWTGQLNAWAQQQAEIELVVDGAVAWSDTSRLASRAPRIRMVWHDRDTEVVFEGDVDDAPGDGASPPPAPDAASTGGASTLVFVLLALGVGVWGGLTLGRRRGAGLTPPSDGQPWQIGDWSVPLGGTVVVVPDVAARIADLAQDLRPVVVVGVDVPHAATAPPEPQALVAALRADTGLGPVPVLVDGSAMDAAGLRLLVDHAPTHVRMVVFVASAPDGVTARALGS
jgi:hypothetical protein